MYIRGDDEKRHHPTYCIYREAMDRSWNFLANSNYLFNIEIIALVPYGSTRMFVAEISRKNEREREREWGFQGHLCLYLYFLSNNSWRNCYDIHWCYVSSEITVQVIFERARDAFLPFVRSSSLFDIPNLFSRLFEFSNQTRKSIRAFQCSVACRLNSRFLVSFRQLFAQMFAQMLEYTCEKQ